MAAADTASNLVALPEMALDVSSARRAMLAVGPAASSKLVRLSWPAVSAGLLEADRASPCKHTHVTKLSYYQARAVAVHIHLSCRRSWSHAALGAPQ